MKALIAKEKGVPAIVDVPKPECGPRDMVAKVKYAGICATDIALITGNTMFIETGQAKYPIRLGHEWVAQVVEVGSEVKNLKPGDIVVGDSGVPCFECEACLAGDYAACPNTKSVGTVNTYDGAFAEYMKMPACLAYKLPDNVNLKSAAMIEPATIAYIGVLKMNVKAGDAVMVMGTGPIGLTGVALLHAIGAKVVLVGRRDSKLAYGLKVGADMLINNKTQDVEEELKKFTASGKVDYVLETSGNPAVLNDLHKYTKSSGKIALAGFFEKVIDGLELDQFVLSGQDIIGVAGHLGDMKQVVRLVEQGKVDFSPLVSKVYKFEDGIEAVNHVMENSGDRMKVMLEFD